MRLVLAALALLLGPPALAVTGGAPPATGWAARAIVMVIDPDGDLCTGTALARDLVLTAAHCVARKKRYEVKPYQTGAAIPVRAVATHPRFDYESYARSRATADVALLKLAAPLPAVVVPARLAPARRVKVGETLVIAGFGTIADRSAAGLGIPRMARLVVTGQPGSLQIRLVDPATRNARPGLGGCTGDSGAPAFDDEGPDKSGQKSGQVIGQIIGVVSWTTAAGNEEGCGGLTGLTPLLSYRSWIVDTARKFGAPINR
jgi:secreted trypsin-like serine protease